MSSGAASLQAGHRPERFALVWPVLLALTVVAVFRGALGNGFVAWDDPNYLLNNPYVQELSAGNLREIFLGFRNGNYHPLPLLSYALEHALFGLSPWGYHAVSLAWHTANCVLLFFLLRALRLSPLAAFAASLLYAVHPLRVEAVAWVTGRKDLMCTGFSLVALLLYTARIRAGRSGFSWGMLVLLALALLSKGTAMALPLLLLIVDRLHGRPMDRRTLGEKGSYLAVALLFAVVALVARASFQDVLDEGGYGPLALLALGFYRLVFYYLARTLVPLPHLVPPYPPLGTFLDPWVLAAAGLCLVFAAAVCWQRRYASRLAMGFWFFVVALLPALCLPVVGYSADRFAYFPSIGLAFCLGLGIDAAARAWPAPPARALGIAGLTVLVGMLAVLTVSRCAVWNNSVTLYSDAVDLFAGRRGQEANLARAHADRGNAYREQRNYAAAVADLTRAVEITPETARPWLLLGATRLAMGQPAAAVDSYTRAEVLAPWLAEAWTGRAVALRQLGALPQSLAAAEEAVRLRPDDPAVYNTRGLTWKEMERPEEALQDFNRVIELAPRRFEGYLNRGMVLRVLGRDEQADRDFRAALQMDPDNRIARKWLDSSPGKQAVDR